MQDVHRDNRSAFVRATVDATQRLWRISANSPSYIVLESSDIPPVASYDHFARAVEYVRKKYSLELTIRGGGYGCCSLVVGADGEDPSEASMLRIIEDEQFQKFIDAVGFDVARILTPGGENIYSAFYDYALVVATNRVRLNGKTKTHLQFGNDRNDEMTFVLLEVAIPRAAAHRGGAFKALWRRVTKAPSLHRESNKDVEIRNNALLTEGEFIQLLKKRAQQGTLLHIHGFATNFTDAVASSILFYHNAELPRLGFLPVLFSWPSTGSPIDYDPDTGRAEESEVDLVKTLSLIQKHTKSLSVSAHSHGNKIFVRALSGALAVKLLPDNSLEHALMLAPDVGSEFLNQQIDFVIRCCKRASLYFSKKDFALKLASWKFRGERAGREFAATTAKLNIIDASIATDGLLSHSYYGVVREVLADIYYALAGIPPQKRKGLEEVPKKSNTWILTVRGRAIE